MSASVASLMQTGSQRLADAGIETAGLDAAVLLGAATGFSRAELIAYPERIVGDKEAEQFHDFLERRPAREPVSKLIGHREFWSLDFAVNADVLDPRPDSETLVAAALGWLEGRAPARILDLGTGSGCLLLSLLSERPSDTGLGVDVSATAVETASHNARALGLADRAEFVVGDWKNPAPWGAFDLVVSNPPYIATGELDALQPEVSRYDPRQALDGGADGLDAYRQIARQIPHLLAPGGAVVIELGAGQHDAVGELLRQAGARQIERHHDLAGHIRCLSVQF